MTASVREPAGLGLGLLPQIEWPLTRGDAAGSGWRTVDGLLGVSILAVIVIAGNFHGKQMPQGLEDFLAIRLTIKNALLLTLFGVVWPALLSACGLYSPARLRSGGGSGLGWLWRAP